MKYQFKGFDQEGNFKSGVIIADSKEEAIKILQTQNIVVTYIYPIDILKITPFLGRISFKDIALFCRSMMYFLRSGFTLDESIKTLALQTQNLKFKSVLQEIYNDVLAGLSLSQALEKHKEIFDASMIKLIRIGELSGTLDKVFENLSNHFESQEKFRSKILSSLYYPAIVFVIFIATMIILFTSVVPKISIMFEENNIPLPPLTMFFQYISKILISYGVYIFLFFIFAIYSAYIYFKSDEGKLFFYNFFINLPIIGPMLKMTYCLRFVEYLAFLIEGGIPIPESLSIVGESMDNPYYRNAILFIGEETKKGKSISDIIQKFTDLFPPFIIQIINTGEKTGQLKSMLYTAKEYYTQELEIKTSTISELIQPFIVAIMAIGLVFLELSLLIPIMNLTKAVREL
ncbi:MAG: type II secretion system F family protein [Candidatus Aenigmatarchaeota archaeon]